MVIFMIYAIVINVVTFIMFGVDKKHAIKRRRRIPEKVLLQMVVIGGGVGAYAGMHVFRHKIHKNKFYLGVPLIFLIELGMIFFLLNRI